MHVNDAIVFVSDMALHLSHEAGPAKGEVRAEEPGRCRTGFSVPDLDGFHARMVAGSVLCIQEPAEVFGARVAQYADPDAMVFSVGEERRGG